jgi:hypothetical protein
MGQSICLFSRELFMTASTARSVSTEALYQKKDSKDVSVKEVSVDCGPMPQQDMSDAHGHDMHQQKLVQLVGCHDDGVDAGKRARAAAIK